jgi:hypothetical protein
MLTTHRAQSSNGPRHHFNEAQSRNLTATFKYMDEMLTSAMRATAKESNDRMVFPEHVADATAAQSTALSEHLEKFRQRLRQFAEQHQLRAPAPIGSIVAFETALEFVGIALCEIRPQGLKGFGHLDSEGADAIVRLIGDLNAIVAQMMAICRDPHLGE